MKKLQLSLETLQVNSFETTSESAVRGTVNGASEPSYRPDCPNSTDLTCGPGTTSENCTGPLYPTCQGIRTTCITPTE